MHFSKLCTPSINIVKKNKTIYKLIPEIWRDFAYFRNIIKDLKQNENEISVEFTQDFDIFWKFLLCKLSSNEGNIIDKALQIKKFCNLFGIDSDSIYLGKLKLLLIAAANCFSSTFPFIPIQTKNDEDTPSHSFSKVFEDLQKRENWKRECIVIFIKSEWNVDPVSVCLNYCLQY